MLIYKVFNKINGKSYIGQTVRGLDKRIYDHIRLANKGSKLLFHNAIRKYGPQSFEWSIIDTAEFLEILDEKEIYWISYLNTNAPNGYNLTDGGEGFRGNHSEETKKKMTVSRTGKHWKRSEEAKRKISIARTGSHHSDETRKKMSDSRKGEKNHSFGKHQSPEHIRKLSIVRTGKHPSEETRKKLSIAAKRQWSKKKEEVCL